MFGLLVLLVGGCIVHGPIGDRGFDHNFVVDSEVDSVVLRVGFADVEVLEGGSNVEVAIDFGGITGNSIGQEVQEGTLYLDYNCLACGGSFVLAVPPKTVVDIAVDAGDVDLWGLDGPITAAVGAGSIDAEALGSQQVDLATGSGSVDATFDAPPDYLRVEVGAGAIDVEVPAGSYDLDLAVGIGSIETDGINNDPDSNREIIAHTAAGAITLHGR